MNRSIFEVKPLSFYKREEVDINEINIGDYVVARVTTLEKEHIILWAGTTKCIMRYGDFEIFSEERNQALAKKYKGKNVYARVAQKTQNMLFLERITVIEKTRDYLIDNCLGTIVTAIVKEVNTSELVVDLGNGFVSIVPIKELSKCRYYILNNYFSAGDRVNVKILEFDEEKNAFRLTRKGAYEPVSIAGYYVIVRVTTAFVDNHNNGMYVEFNPGNTGIMDIPTKVNPRIFHEGDEAVVYIKKYNKNGFQCRFIHKC